MAKQNDEFWEAYRDPRWQKRRLEIMDQADWACEECGDTGKTLNVHHCYYEKGKMPWDYPDDALKCWCETCHKNFHRLKQSLFTLISRGSLDDLRAVVGYCWAISCESDDEQAGFPPQLNCPFTKGFGDRFWLTDGELVAASDEDGRVDAPTAYCFYDARVANGGR